MAGLREGVELPDCSVLRQLCRAELAARLDSVSGLKDLVLDAELMKPLDRVAGASLLKEHGVDKIYKLEPGKSLSDCEKRIYIVRSLPLLTRHISDQINAERSAGIKHRSYRILFVPRKLHVCEMILEREGVHGYVSCDEFSLDLIPLDRDLLSLEMPHFFRSCYLDGDETWIHTVAQSVVNIQLTFGTFANIYCIGRCAQMVYEMTKVLMESEPEQSHLHSAISQLILVDRDCDYVTPLCSQVTYEGLLDDTFSINSGFVEFGPEIAGSDQKTKLLLSSEDLMYEEIRNRHFSNVSSFLSEKAKALQTGYDKRHTLSSVSAMKDFVANDLKTLKQQHKSLALHVGACEYISNVKTKGDFEEQLHTEHCLLEGVSIKESISYIEELIYRQANPETTMRMLCLLSVTTDGLQPAVYTALKTQFAHSYGFESLLTLENLRHVGLFTEHEQSHATKLLTNKLPLNVAVPCPFRSVSKKLNLIPKSAEEIDLRKPNDMSYVFSGAYTPVLCRLVEQLLVNEVFVDELARLLPLPVFSDCKSRSVRGQSSSSSTSSRVVLVYFIGGCSYSEIIALRFLGKQRGYKFLIATTSIVNGSKLVSSVSEAVS